MSDNVTASGLFSHTKAEAVFQKMLENVAKHEKELACLRLKVEKSVQSALETLRNRVDQINEEIVNLSQRVEHVENSIKIPGSPSSAVTVGEGLACNRRALARTLNLVAAKADTDDVNEMFTEYDGKMTEAVQNLRRDLASNDTISKVNEAIQAIGRRVGVVAEDVNNKVDNSMFKTISTEYNLIRNYDQFVKDSQETLNQHGKEIAENRNDITTYNSSVKELLHKAEKIESHIETKPWAFDVAQMEENLTASIDTKAEKKMISTQASRIKNLENQLLASDKDRQIIHANHETLSKQFCESVYDKANIDHIITSSCVSKDRFMEIMKQITDEIETKASNLSLTELNDQVQNLSSEHFITRKKVDLAAQFIEWYSRNGDKS